VSQTLDAVLQKGQTMPEKNRFPAVLQPVVIDRAAFNQGENAQYDPHIGEADVMDTVVARGPHAVGQDFNPADPSFTLRRGGVQHGVLTPMAVRRLTPNECLRLQGFPDNWTNIPWKGKPEGQAPDGPQYKCAGNSFAVPVVRWIGTRIAAQP
jgi:site-specific DNA-cytosine methylase